MNIKNAIYFEGYPISDQWGQNFAKNWLMAWNSRDLDKICEYYADEVMLVSPTVSEMIGRRDGLLLKKNELREMWTRIFEEIPELEYSLVAVAVGISSLTIHYSSSECSMIADVVRFDDCWKITRSSTYY